MAVIFKTGLLLQDIHERLARNTHPTELLHLFLSFFLFLKKLPLSRNVSTIQFGGNILSKGGDIFTSNDRASERCLNSNCKLSFRNSFLKLDTNPSTESPRPFSMDDHGKCLHFFPSNKNIELC